mmetsp:Transcript_8146/g.17701  ORF Transcript_8146/g.17701 Transcript_8146/m.17701 type:complete len:249 (+) Transcript_8146:238-984(+)
MDHGLEPWRGLGERSSAGPPERDRSRLLSYQGHGRTRLRIQLGQQQRIRRRRSGPRRRQLGQRRSRPDSLRSRPRLRSLVFYRVRQHRPRRIGRFVRTEPHHGTVSSGRHARGTSGGQAAVLHRHGPHSGFGHHLSHPPGQPRRRHSVDRPRQESLHHRSPPSRQGRIGPRGRHQPLGGLLPHLRRRNSAPGKPSQSRRERSGHAHPDRPRNESQRQRYGGKTQAQSDHPAAGTHTEAAGARGQLVGL